MNRPYSILVLRGAEMRHFVVRQERVRELVLAAILVLAIGGLLFTKHLEAQRQTVDELVTSARAQKEKLSALRERVIEVQETLSHWKGLREKIGAALPQGNKRSVEGEELHEILAALQGELNQMIGALPSSWPLAGRVTSGVGMRPSPWTGEMQYHAGLDIPNPIGTAVHASGDAFVESIDAQRGTIILNHGQQIKTHYAHLSKILVTPGERVRKGKPIAQVGNRGKSTGPHLHYEVRVAGVAVDPRRFLIGVGHSE